MDLYTHHRNATSIGPLYPLETFIDIRIRLNKEAADAKIPRYAVYAHTPATSSDHPSANHSGATPRSRNGFGMSVDPTSPLRPATPGAGSPSLGQSGSSIGVRGQSGTVRFMLDAARAREEQAIVDTYYKVEEEEYEVATSTGEQRSSSKSGGKHEKNHNERVR